jgi:nucleosome binding factor SPN SPT16 subunit
MPYAYFHPTVNINDYIESLSYGLLGLIDLGQTTMIETYLDYIVSVIENRQLVKFSMKLSDTDLDSLDYSQPIYIQAGEYTGQYFLNKIDGYDGRSLTDVYLMKLV